MYEKIDSMEDLQRLQPGAIVIRYPAIGLPEDTIDLSDGNAYLSYQVFDLQNDKVQLRIPDNEINPATQAGDVPHMDGRDDPPTLLQKDLKAMTEEGVWWICY